MLEKALTPAEVDRLNHTLDLHEHLSRRSPSYGGSHPGMVGEGNPVGRICKALVDQVGAGAGGELLAYQAAASALREAGFPGDGPTADAERLRAALEALKLPGGHPPLNGVQIEELVALGHPEEDGTIRLGSTRIDLGGMLEWPQPHCEPFRELLVHPRVKPVLEEILGVGYRMDHSPDLMRMEKGGDGQTLHGGGFERYSAGGMLESYSFHANQMFAGMVVVEFMLAVSLLRQRSVPVDGLLPLPLPLPLPLSVPLPYARDHHNRLPEDSYLRVCITGRRAR